MLQYRIIPVTPFQQNCTVLWCDQTRGAAIVDPGGDLHLIEAAIKQESLKPVKIILTHGHLDHVGGTLDLAEKYQIPIEGPHEADKFWLDELPQHCQMMNFPMTKAFAPERWLHQDEEVAFGNVTLKVLHCPGHTPGHVVLYHPESRLALVGDVLFHGSIGRTDFPQGNHQDLLGSIAKKLWPLGNDVQFIPGHGPMSTFGEERKTNPFVADSQLQQ